LKSNTLRCILCHVKFLSPWSTRFVLVPCRFAFALTVTDVNIFCTQIAKKVVSSLFTYGSLLDTSAVFTRVLESPEIRELVTIGGHPDNRHKYWDTLKAITANIKEYLTVVLGTKGSRSTVNQRAYRTVLAACSGTNLKNVRQTSDVLVRTFYLSCVFAFVNTLFIHVCCLQGIAPRNVLRAVKDRFALQEHPGSGYVACSRKTYRNKMPDKVCISERLHTYKEG